MINMKANNPKRRKACRQPSQSGMALIIVLFLILIMSILAISMVATVNSDMLINGYYGNSRAAYYAADSGMNVARQYLHSQLNQQVNSTACLGWGPNAVPGCTSDPLVPTTAAQAAYTNLLSAFGNFSGGQINYGNSAKSRPSSFMIQNTSACTLALTPSTTPPTINQSTVNGIVLNTEYLYTFNYTLCATGTGASASMQRLAVAEIGTITLDVKAVDNPPPTFAGYGQFVTNQASCPGSYLTPGLYTGPTYTDGTWALGDSGPYTFTGTLSQSQSQIDYYINGQCTKSSSTTIPKGINAKLLAGMQLNAASISPPTDSFNQAWAVLNGSGMGYTTPPTAANLNAEVKNVSAQPYPLTGSATGVYLPYYLSPTTNTYTFGYLDSTPQHNPHAGGGIYVQGNASIVLAATTDTGGNPTQQYTITQGSTVTTIVTNPATNTTTITAGGTTQTIAGIPENLASDPGAMVPGTMLYVNGTISGLTGPSNTSSPSQDTASTTGTTNSYAAIQNNSMVTVAGSGDINITGNLLYANEPVTRDANDTLVLAQNTADSTQTLGVFTANGSIILNSPYSDKNLETDGSLAAIGTAANCGTNTCGFKTSDSINTWNNVGGQIQSNQFVCDLKTANTYYDQRFSQWSNFFPPWFPSTSTGGNSYVPAAPQTVVTQQRSSWMWLQK